MPGKGRREERVHVAWMTSVPAKTKSCILWSHIFPLCILCQSSCCDSLPFFRIRSIRLCSKDEENAATPTKWFPLYLKGLSFSLLWGKEKERVRECACGALYLDFYLNLGIPGLLCLSFSCNSSLIFFKSNKPPSQTLTKESQPWRSPGLGIEASLISVPGEPVWAGGSGQKCWPMLSGPNGSPPLSPEPLWTRGSPQWWQFLPSFPDEVACLPHVGLSFFTF